MRALCQNCNELAGTNPNCPSCGRFSGSMEQSTEDSPTEMAREFGINIETAIEILEWVDQRSPDTTGVRDGD